MIYMKGINYFRILAFISLSIILIASKNISTSENQNIVLNFDKAEKSDDWFVINDVVMGGLSQSSFTFSGNGTAVFSGMLSLENSGGFASSSKKPANYNLEGFNGIRLRVKGDGKDYKITLKNDGAFNGFSYRFKFSTRKGTWITVDAPFSSFVPKFMGQTVDAPPIDTKNIKTFGFQISDKQAGPFRLEIDWIAAMHKIRINVFSHKKPV